MSYTGIVKENIYVHLNKDLVMAFSFLSSIVENCDA